MVPLMSGPHLANARWRSKNRLSGRCVPTGGSRPPVDQDVLLSEGFHALGVGRFHAGRSSTLALMATPCRRPGDEVGDRLGVTVSVRTATWSRRRQRWAMRATARGAPVWPPGGGAHLRVRSNRDFTSSITSGFAFSRPRGRRGNGGIMEKPGRRRPGLARFTSSMRASAGVSRWPTTSGSSRARRRWPGRTLGLEEHATLVGHGRFKPASRLRHAWRPRRCTAACGPLSAELGSLTF